MAPQGQDAEVGPTDSHLASERVTNLGQLTFGKACGYRDKKWDCSMTGSASPISTQWDREKKLTGI